MSVVSLIMLPTRSRQPGKVDPSRSTETVSAAAALRREETSAHYRWGSRCAFASTNSHTPARCHFDLALTSRMAKPFLTSKIGGSRSCIGRLLQCARPHAGYGLTSDECASGGRATWFWPFGYGRVDRCALSECLILEMKLDGPTSAPPRIAALGRCPANGESPPSV